MKHNCELRLRSRELTSNVSHFLRLPTARARRWALIGLPFLLAALLLVYLQRLIAQTVPPQRENNVTIRGHVVTASGVPVPEATVRLNGQSAAEKAQVLSDANGLFVFSELPIGNYVLTAEKGEMRSQPYSFVASKQGEQPPIGLILREHPKTPVSSPFGQSMEFADKPTFTVAGVTDWTAAGGHGSDAILRTSEALTRETLDLMPNDANALSGEPESNEEATKHRLAGETDERLGNPLAAAHEYEQAVRLNPSEQNYFAWGSELLFHRAIWQAKVVFEQGVKQHPNSERLLTGLGSALFAAALYDDAARRLCEASDLNPSNREPYIFMGKIDLASPNSLACIEPRLARFAQLQPNEALACYLYAMAIWKQHGQPLDEATDLKVRGLLTKAVTIDPNCGDAYLQLGNLEATKQNYPAAVDFYKKAIDANSELNEAHYRLAIAYDRVGDQAKARQEFLLHDEIEQRQAAAVDRQRREIKQFVVATP